MKGGLCAQKRRSHGDRRGLVSESGTILKMPKPTRPRLLNSSAIIILAVSAAFLASCASTSGPHSQSMTRKTRSKEYFSEKEYGVKASPRVSNLRTRLPRGGGRDQVGKPYKIAGKWYYPKEDRHYRKVGAASWLEM